MKWGKRIGIGVGVVFGALLLAILVLPFVINVDNYRPQIVAAVNDQINGKLELGKLKLSLWGEIKIEVDGFSVADAKGSPIVSAKDVYFHLAFASLFSGSPVLTFKMKHPEIRVIKDKAGKLNVLGLMKPAVVASAGKAETPGATSKPMELPAIAARAALGVEMQEAQLSYRDEATKLVSEVKDLNLRIRNISLTKPSDFEMWASLDTRMGKTLVVKGPAKVSGKLIPKFKGSEFEEGTLYMLADLDGVGISLPGLFEKKAGLATNMDMGLRFTTKSAQIEKLKAAFFNIVITGNGELSNLDTTPSFKVSMKSNDVDLKPWSELLPMLKEFELGGIAGLSAQASGTADVPQYKADISFKNITAKAPNLKAQPHLDGVINIITDQVQNAVVTMKAPGNDLKMVGKVVSFKRPKITLEVTSSGMDLDQLIDFPKPVAAAPAGKSSGTSAEGTASQEGAANFDAMLDPMRQNDILVSAALNARANLAFVKAKGIRISPLTASLSMKDLNLSLDSFAMGVFNGKISATMQAALKPKTPTYRIKTEVTGLDLQKAVESQYALFKNTVIGQANFKMEGTGASFNPDPAKKNLNVRGNMRVNNATFTTIDVGKMASEAINKAVNDLGQKIPGLKGKTIPQIKTETGYEYVASDFSIAGAKFSAPDFVAKARPNKGIDFNGSTEVGLLDFSLKAAWELVDTYNITKARDLSVESNGVTVNPLLADGSNPVRLPIRISGTCFAPNIDYTSVPEALAKVALNNVGKALEAKAKAEVQKRVQQEVSKVAPQLNKEVNKAFKGIFGK